MAREHISFSNERVIAFIQEAKKHRKMSRFIEDAVLFYLDNMAKEEKYVTKEDVKDILIEYLGQVVFTGPIQNQNYVQEKENIKSEIEDIMALGDD